MSTNNQRITPFAVQADGSRHYGLTVNGVRVLVIAEDGQHTAGFLLANQIAAIGPEGIPDVEMPKPAVDVPDHKPKRRNFEVGQRVWCNVHGCQGECTITAIGEGRNHGRVKISGERCWCPVGNFDALEDDQ